MRLACGDEVREIAVRAAGAALEVTVDGVAYPVDVEPTGPGSFVRREGDAVETFHCVRDGATVHLFWRGATYRLRLEKDGMRAGTRGGASGLEAPMPGKVIKVAVRPGDSVTKGQELLVVEAMKMENALRAPRDGLVKRVSAAVGDMVTPGVVLVELE